MFQSLLQGESFDFTNSIASAEFFAQVGRVGTKAMSITTLQNPLTRTGEATRIAIAPAHEFFIENSDTESKEITINRTSVDFGYTAYMSSSEVSTLTITNHTRGKVCVQWEVPDVHSDPGLHDKVKGQTWRDRRGRRTPKDSRLKGLQGWVNI